MNPIKPDSLVARLAMKAQNNKEGNKPMSRPAPIQKKVSSEKTNRLSRRPI